jgi:hypothetical protein
MKQYAIYSEEARGSQDRPNVVRVLNSFHHKDNSPLKVSNFFKDISWRHQRQRPRLYHHPLVMLRPGNPSDLIVFSYLEGNALAVGPLKEMIERVLSFRGHKDTLNVGTTMLKDREATLHAVVLNAVLFVEMGRFILRSTSPSCALCGTRM